MAPNMAGRIFSPTNPDLADILGRTDLDFENFYFFDFLDPWAIFSGVMGYFVGPLGIFFFRSHGLFFGTPT